MRPEKEFLALIEQNKGIIFKVIRLYVRHAEDERDLFQEVLFQAWKSYPRFNGLSKFSTWLYRVSLNTVLSFKRRPDVVETREHLETGTLTVTQPSPDTEILYQSILSLPEVDRMIVTLHLDGYENEEIAEITGLTRNHVGVKLHRAKSILIEKLKRS